MGASTPRSARPLRTPRRRVVDESRQQQLLDEVAGIFFEDGFTGVGVDDLARRLHCSKATLYGLAGSKEQLVMRITKRFFARSAAEIERAVGDESDPRRLVESYLEGIGTAMSSTSPRFHADMVAYPPTAEVYAHSASVAAQRVRQMIDQGVAGGHFRAVHGVFASQLVAMAIEGIHSGELLRDTGLSAGEAFTELSKLLLNGLQS